MQHLYGLIGYPLSHSFSKQYFTQKFEREHIANARYELFELENIAELPALFEQYPQLKGLNVTIPYKQQVQPFLDEIEENAQNIGAVNTIKFTPNGRRIGYNSDYYGFKTSLESWMPVTPHTKALVLGSGGASQAVLRVLENLHIAYLVVSRTAGNKAVDYDTLKNTGNLASYSLIINTTPLGMLPNTDTYPDLAYDQLGPQHYCYDLVYNPENTQFMHRAAIQGAHTKNGLDMLRLQAEKSWEIWNQ